MKSTLSRCLLAVCGIAVSSCAPFKYKATNKVYKKQAKEFSRIYKYVPATNAGQDSLSLAADWVGTTNFSMRKPNFVVIHHTAQDSVGQTLSTFTLKRTEVSAHYVVAKDGTIYHMLNDYFRAHHAGVSKWGNATDLNSSSIGIELDNNGFEPFDDRQIASLLKLLGNLKKNYSIPAANFIGHADVAPRRKPDPNEHFPWQKLAEKGFGLWYDNIIEVAPANFDPVPALRIIGYDTGDLKSAVIAFKRHFIQSDIAPKLTQHDLDVLYNVYRKYL
ncbi:N-acetylmuramoyl-L-alanine amidase [Hufsiella ginkgonis]|uniref:N-acetylmuramoyl-L-alanine amidase n=1 Tax=Hufsiella ginkgonis TaxID=2695274 RepID=A0A7K1XT17_9SPHI|nr:N-acetylmuramoyl-L-alanine amidase [Hufsiella ginkgonis]MXV14141.1 N-acetylmuramoyl-L-alanine amidase [Hufsiella ginkgonis]